MLDARSEVRWMCTEGAATQEGKLTLETMLIIAVWACLPAFSHTNFRPEMFVSGQSIKE